MTLLQRTIDLIYLSIISIYQQLLVEFTNSDIGISLADGKDNFFEYMKVFNFSNLSIAPKNSGYAVFVSPQSELKFSRLEGRIIKESICRKSFDGWDMIGYVSEEYYHYLINTRIRQFLNSG